MRSKLLSIPRVVGQHPEGWRGRRRPQWPLRSLHHVEQRVAFPAGRAQHHDRRPPRRAGTVGAAETAWSPGCCSGKEIGEDPDEQAMITLKRWSLWSVCDRRRDECSLRRADDPEKITLERAASCWLNTSRGQVRQSDAKAAKSRKEAAKHRKYRQRGCQSPWPQASDQPVRGVGQVARFASRQNRFRLVCGHRTQCMAPARTATAVIMMRFRCLRGPACAWSGSISTSDADFVMGSCDNT